MNKEDIKFTIDQLRKDKIIYAVEACAINILCLFSFLFSNMYLQSNIKNILNIFLIIIAVSYSLYMGVGNFYRLSRIKQLEKKLT